MTNADALELIESYEAQLGVIRGLLPSEGEPTARQWERIRDALRTLSAGIGRSANEAAREARQAHVRMDGAADAVKHARRRRPPGFSACHDDSDVAEPEQSFRGQR